MKTNNFLAWAFHWLHTSMSWITMVILFLAPLLIYFSHPQSFADSVTNVLLFVLCWDRCVAYAAALQKQRDDRRKSSGT